MLASGAGGSCRSTTRPRSPPPSAGTSSSPDELAAARAEARRIGSTLAWPSVAEATASVLREALALAPRATARRRRRPAARRACAPTTCSRSSTTCGIVQHAHGIIPNRDSGYCVDDVARLAVVALALARRGDEQMWTLDPLPLARLPPRRRPSDGGMRNFMSYDRRWLDEPHVGDHVGRSVWALGEILATAWIPAVVEPARRSARLGSSARSQARSRCERPRTRCSASRASTRTGSTRRARSLLERFVDAARRRVRAAPRPTNGAGSRTSSATTTRGFRRR